jgi:4-amino-4-deoxy-L-arabinose transferase-like glycosyltransferase
MRNRTAVGRPDARVVFIALWAALLLVKTAMAARLPLFVDEAFYWQESRHLAWAYSDLPGLTAWMIRVGTALFGDGVLAVRLPFLLVAAALPWLVVRIAAREFDARTGWIAGTATLLLPLVSSLGLMALPDAAMALATLFCIDAGARLLRRVSHGAALQLGAGLAIGALSHYRFAAVIGVGLLVLLMLPSGRRVLRDPRVLIAVAFGAAAWTPLLAWNIENAEAGLRFQLVERHPWAWQSEGVLFIAIQSLLVTPLMFAGLLWAGWRARQVNEGVRFLGWLGLLVLAGFFVLGFFADTERVSFHWPLPGYLALLPLLPVALLAWPRWLRVATWALAACGLAAVMGYYAFVSTPALRAQAAAMKWYPSNFAGWDELARATERRLQAMPDDTIVVADNFKIGAELGFAMGNADIKVLEHPLNRAHGRAPQLQLWGLQSRGRVDWGDRPVLLVVGASDVKFSGLVDHYQRLCERAGPLPPPEVVSVDNGARRFLLLALPAAPADGDAACVTPAVAHVDTPRPGARVPRTFEVQGWAVKDGVGVRSVWITLDGRRVAEADYGRYNGWVAGFFQGRSSDPNHPDVGFRAMLDTGDLPAGPHWLGLEIEGADGSVETWASGQQVRLDRQ